MIDEKIQDEDYKYLFIDEVQNVEGFEEGIYHCNMLDFISKDEEL